MRPNNYRVVKPILDTDNYCGFKLRFRDGFADRFIMRDMLKRNYGNIPPNPKVVIDIGAHIGLFTLAAIRSGAEKIYAFEPEASNFELLCHNMEINGYKERVICINKGVGIPGKAKLYIHPTNSGGSSSDLAESESLNPDNYQVIDIISIHQVFDLYDMKLPNLTVGVSSPSASSGAKSLRSENSFATPTGLRSVYSRRGIKYCDLLKIDCEGAEKDIINEFDDDLAKKIGQITVEFHYRNLMDELIVKLSKWYKAECINKTSHKGGYAWLFKPKQ